MKTVRIQEQRGVRGAGLARWALVLSLAAGLGVFPGCKQHASGDMADQSGKLSPEEDANLAQLTRELHRTMVRQKLSGSFEEFAAARSDLTIPPPPGKKYAISKKWKVIEVDR